MEEVIEVSEPSDQRRDIFWRGVNTQTYPYACRYTHRPMGEGRALLARPDADTTIAQKLGNIMGVNTLHAKGNDTGIGVGAGQNG